LGATLFEVFAGRPPHEGPTLGALFASSLASPPTVPAQVPEEIAEICRRAMARAPGDRYASAGELRAALADVLDHRESMRLAHRAQTRLGALLEELAEQPPPDAAEVRRLFDECRFGFRAALDAWPANPVAKGALRLALEAMAGHEVSAGNLPAARAVVAELEAPPAELLRQLADLERRTATEASERSRLRALERDLDPRVGSRTRTFLSAVLGSLWTALPIVSHFLLGARDSGPEIQASMATAAGSLPLVLGLGYWARESLRKTALNRRIFALLLFVLASQLVLGAACLVAGVASAVAVPLTFFLWFVAAGLAAITIEIGAWPTALAFLVCLFLALSEPRWTLVLMGISQAILTVNALAIWGPLLRAPRDAPR
ncbi:MAG: hypothetical protein FJ104_14590, partial [Deltaproteobacteria bacterium]|nr:hypothetical protein [Deltaproteobacteria bacterium]